MNPRFTIDGSPTLEAHLSAICAKVVEGISNIVPAGKVEAILLAGGYGRGEGGVLKTERGDRPYNDLEFYVCISGSAILNERRYGPSFHHLGEHLSADAGVEVEFKIISLRKIERSEPSMFLYDLAQGHRTLFGDDTVLRNERFQNPALIPLHEATRLLMNRCSGLLFAEERLQRKPFTDEDADFVGRNQAKAQLAFGDVVLTTDGQYHWSCRERNTSLRQLSEQSKSPFLRSLFCHHNIGVDFKLHPQKKKGPAEFFRGTQSELSALACQLWLQLENQRLGQTFDSVKAYAFSDVDKCPETRALRNRLVHAKRFGLSAAFEKDSTRYPRERILNSLPLLLWDPSVLSDPLTLKRVQEQLRTDAKDFPALVAAYRSLWQHFN